MPAIFSDIKTPYVNQVTLKRMLVSKVKENIFQNIITRPEEAATEKFSTDTDAAELQIIRVLPNDGQARLIGSDINGGYFNSDDARQPATMAYGIKILNSIDYNIDIPTNMQDMVNTDMAAAELENLAGKVARNVNSMTLAAQLLKNFNSIALGAPSNWVTVNTGAATADMWKNAIIAAGSKLDEGNLAQGIETYPESNRAIFIRPTAKAELLKTGNIIIGGSNYAQDILQKGGLDSETRPSNITGYLGEVSNMPVYMASPAIWSLVEQYLGLAPNALAKVYGVCVSSIGTGRALAFNSVMKMIDAPSGQGIRLQPKYRMGAECWDELSVVPIVDTTFTNPASSASLLNITPPGSRPAATLNTVTVASNAITASIDGSYSATGNGTTAAVAITAPAGITTTLYNSSGTIVTSPLNLGAVGSTSNFIIVAAGTNYRATVFKLNITRS